MIFILGIVIICIIFTYFYFFSKSKTVQPFNNIWSFEDKENGIKLLRIIKTQFEHIKIDYFPVYETLLGYVRNNKFINWEDGISLAIPKTFLKYSLFNNESTKAQYNMNFIRVKLNEGQDWPFVDIIGYEEKDGLIHLDKFSIPKEDIFPSKTNIFEGFVFTIPNNPDNV